MGIKVFCIEDSKRYDITDITNKSISWSKSPDEFAQKLSFDILDVKKAGFVKNPVKIGSVIEVISSKTEFSGIVITSNKVRNGSANTAVDFVYYFNQNEEIYQFDNVKASTCIESVFSSMGAPTGTLDSVDVVIDKIYFNSSAGGVIKDIIDIILMETGKKYRFYYRDGKFHFRKYKDTVESYEIDFYNKKYDINSFLDDVSLSKGINNMKNAVKIVIKNNESQYETKSLRDDGNIEKYGIMQKVLEIEASDKYRADSMAENFIKENSKVNENLSLSIPWMEGLYEGDNVIIKNGDLEIDGVYRIVNFTKYTEKINLELEPYE
ncbi:hypothetical protein [uncultured Ilyobacter sp.]|uniref:XkdQ/YqbQ family protein n=1 Tax=uncultured Ilyobacter sp. TaxID=544433 RepID=UPI0029BFC613|nr:hypothetical protein [uncultured Ilyobacter sp.]